MQSQTPVDDLLETLLQHTLRLQQLVLQAESDPEQWVAVLDDREHTIKQIQSLLDQGVSLTQQQKQQYLKKVYDIDQELYPVMEQKKAKISGEMNKLQLSKTATRGYGSYETGYTPYGAFFDKKK